MATISSIGLLKTLLSVLSTVKWQRIRRSVGDGFVYIGVKISGRNKHMQSVIDLTMEPPVEGKDIELKYAVSLTIRRYDIYVGTYSTYEEAASIADNIDRAIEESQS